MNKERLSADSLILHSSLFNSLVIDREKEFMLFDDKNRFIKKYNSMFTF